MSRRDETIPADWFEILYRTQDDPWGFRTSAYERAKYDATLAALPRPRFGHALEVGCAIGVFTALLAPRCDALLAIDGSRTALEAARRANAEHPHVGFEERLIPGAFPHGPFDLIVLSEVLYYLTAEDLDLAAARCMAAQGSSGDTVVTCHWLGETDYPLTGLDATERFAAILAGAGYAHEILHRDTYRLDRLIRR